MSKLKSIDEIEAQWYDLVRPKDRQKFQHYKGGKYEILATGFLEDTETPCIIYRSIEKNIVWVRTAQNFLEEVEYRGVMKPRFKQI